MPSPCLCAFLCALPSSQVIYSSPFHREGKHHPEKPVAFPASAGESGALELKLHLFRDKTVCSTVRVLALRRSPLVCVPAQPVMNWSCWTKAPCCQHRREEAGPQVDRSQ